MLDRVYCIVLLSMSKGRFTCWVTEVGAHFILRCVYGEAESKYNDD